MALINCMDMQVDLFFSCPLSSLLLSMIWLSWKHTILTQSIGRPYLLTIHVLKFEIVHSTTSWCVQNIAVCMANSVDPVRPCILQHLIWVYTVCKGLSVQILWVIMVCLKNITFLSDTSRSAVTITMYILVSLCCNNYILLPLTITFFSSCNNYILLSAVTITFYCVSAVTVTFYCL